MQTFQETVEAQLGQLTYRCAVLGQQLLESQEDNRRLKEQINATLKEQQTAKPGQVISSNGGTLPGAILERHHG